MRLSPGCLRSRQIRNLSRTELQRCQRCSGGPPGRAAYFPERGVARSPGLPSSLQGWQDRREGTVTAEDAGWRAASPGWAEDLDRAADVLAYVRAQLQPLSDAAGALIEVLAQGGIVLSCGNGGSALQAQ